ncbi:biotin transport system substrate-specific component [Desulfacinum hydrothermale DSM 13146]|uniref:Biotin transporter n=1 Tax=Desulfacinum hydrothermale DSM 13146 TaxID=1121390 RepID=A0A1W1X0G0_9BACT|nr:biotin transporter BioY [Desulfacinum hydrothermale]SMC17208.1 biotin transport system substrate-specific component [Desulfacinum hydrothermale DSM 13146]
MPLESIRKMVLVCLMTALTAVGAQIAVPIGPVPIVLTNLFVLLAGLLLGPTQGAAAMGLYLLLGAVGLPVFANFKGGLAHLLGPTGGYLLGFVAAAWLVGVLSHGRPSRWFDGIAVVLGSLVIYALGVPWLKVVTGMAWTKALAVGMLPFLVGDAVKAAAAVMLAWSLRPALLRHVRTASA